MHDPGSPWKARQRGHAAPPSARSDRREPQAQADVQPGLQRERRDAELRLHGLNAVRAVFARRPQAIRKLYLAEARIPQLQPLLKWCVANRVGYRVVDEADLQKLAASAHHDLERTIDCGPLPRRGGLEPSQQWRRQPRRRSGPSEREDLGDQPVDCVGLLLPPCVQHRL